MYNTVILYFILPITDGIKKMYVDILNPFIINTTLRFVFSFRSIKKNEGTVNISQ